LLDKVTNKEALRRVNEDRQILNSIWHRKHRRIGHVLRHDGLLHEIIEGRMKGKPTRGRRRIQMLHDLANNGGFVALKGAAEDREVWRQRKDVKNLLYSRRLLMMATSNVTEETFLNYLHFLQNISASIHLHSGQLWTFLANHVIVAKSVDSYRRRLDKHWENELCFDYQSVSLG